MTQDKLSTTTEESTHPLFAKAFGASAIGAAFSFFSLVQLSETEIVILSPLLAIPAAFGLIGAFAQNSKTRDPMKVALCFLFQAPWLLVAFFGGIFPSL